MTSLNAFSLILATGASFGLFRIALASRPSQRMVWLLAGLLTLGGALLGARLGYVVLHLSYFSKHILESFAFWRGGLTWVGALGGALLTLLLAKKIWQWSFFSLLDRLSLLLLPLGVAGWLACWLSGAAYGQPLPVAAWWGIQAIDEASLLALRTPVQPLAAISLLVFMGFTELVILQNQTIGWKGSLACLVFSADMLLFSFLRADSSQRWLGLRPESWAGILFTLAGIAAVLWILFREGKIKINIDFKQIYKSIIAFLKNIIDKIKKLRKPHETETGTGTD
jgi:phosphatidylglycerol:prolipoprotein diacylglycerol transferase